MKQVLLMLITALFLSSCSATWEGVKDDSSDNWEATKDTSEEIYDKTKKSINEMTK